VSIIEALVASALLGIVGMVGLTAWDTAVQSSKTAVRLAWAQCMVRSELDAVLAAPWADSSYPTPNSSLLTVAVTPVASRPAQGPGQEQSVLVQAIDPQSRAILYEAAALKVQALQGNKPLDAGVLSDIVAGCPKP
jgi:Tfp pilus assembly protein PilV